MALRPVVEYNVPSVQTDELPSEDTMLEELMQTGESEMERILRLRGYL